MKLPVSQNSRTWWCVSTQNWRKSVWKSASTISVRIFRTGKLWSRQQESSTEITELSTQWWHSWQEKSPEKIFLMLKCRWRWDPRSIEWWWLVIYSYIVKCIIQVFSISATTLSIPTFRVITVTAFKVILVICSTYFWVTLSTELDLACILRLLCVDNHFYLGFLANFCHIKMIFEFFDDISTYFLANVHNFCDWSRVNGHRC